MSIEGNVSGIVIPSAAEVARGAAAVELPVLRIDAPRGWQLVNVRELWKFRELCWFLVWRDVKVRYKQTALGVAWAVLQPAMMMVVFTVFFGRLAGLSSGGFPYPVFVYVGLLPWMFFAAAVTGGGNSVVGSERLITKIYFPRLAIPFAAVGAAAVDFAVAFGLLAVLMAYYQIAPTLQMLMAAPIFGVILLTAAGVGTALAALNVAYRDFRYVMPFMVQVWMFATPTVYMQPGTGKAADGLLQTLLVLNPMTGLIGGFRAACLGGPMPWGQLAMSAAFGVLAFVGGCLFFRRQERNFADVI